MMANQTEYDQLKCRLFADFNSAFLQLTTVEEVGIMLDGQKGERNCSPIHIQDHCIGVEKWSIDGLFSYAYNCLFKNKGKMPLFDNQLLHQLTRCVVLFCSDCTTAWNLRKERIFLSAASNENLKEKCLSEVHLTKLALRIHPKSSEAFAHRRWVLHQLLKSNIFTPVDGWSAAGSLKLCEDCRKLKIQLPSQSLCRNGNEILLLKDDPELVKNELEFCQSVAEWHACNYNAWSHRVWILNHLILPFIHQFLVSSSSDDVLRYHRNVSLLKSELEVSMKWLELHVSDHSCMAYVQLLMKLLTLLYAFESCSMCCCSKDSPKSKYRETTLSFVALCDMWKNVFQQCTDLITFYNGIHVALWCHRRGLMLIYHKLARLVFISNEKENSVLGADVSLLQELFSYKSERKFCDKFIETSCSLNRDLSVPEHSKQYRVYFEKFVLQ